MAITLPHWLESLRMEARAGVRWYTADEHAAAYAAARAPRFDPGSQWMAAETAALAAVLLKDKLAIGECSPLQLASGTVARVRCWLDLRAPDQLWLSLDGLPPFLWLPAGRDAESLAQTLRPYLPPDLFAPHAAGRGRPGDGVEREARGTAQPGRNPAHTRACRLLLASALDESDLDLVQIENHLARNPFCDPEFLFQGTACWNTQEDPTVTVVRTNYSRSVVRLLWYESLAGTLFTEIEYTPAGEGAVIAAYNEQFDQRYPPDVPVDVPAMLMGFDAVDEAPDGVEAPVRAADW